MSSVLSSSAHFPGLFPTVLHMTMIRGLQPRDALTRRVQISLSLSLSLSSGPHQSSAIANPEAWIHSHSSLDPYRAPQLQHPRWGCPPISDNAQLFDSRAEISRPADGERPGGAPTCTRATRPRKRQDGFSFAEREAGQDPVAESREPEAGKLLSVFFFFSFPFLFFPSFQSSLLFNPLSPRSFRPS